MILNLLNDTFNNHHKNVWFDYQTAKRNGIIEFDKNVCVLIIIIIVLITILSLMNLILLWRY